MSKQTAVEWLVEQIVNHNGVNSKTFEKAKAMEREQMIPEITQEEIDEQAYLIDNTLQRMFFRSGIEWCRNIIKMKQHETYKGGEQ